MKDMENIIAERHAEHLLYETKEGKQITNLEKMTSKSREIINILEDFANKKGITSDMPINSYPNYAEIIQELKDKTEILDEEVLMNFIVNIRENIKNSTIVTKYGISDNGIVSGTTFKFCRILINGYNEKIENEEDTTTELKKGTSEKIVHTLNISTQDEI